MLEKKKLNSKLKTKEYLGLNSHPTQTEQRYSYKIMNQISK